ncbi:MAG: pyruvate dehydrogenase (acetyl-transferring), homodimeric type [Gemmatimonadetes bacterium]|mgnify:FL=1|jgi:pyruvate dehydrogenase E1 component|nr:pyruvate dehydrogenase (acetyl-transferring), homodimeric type [Gemmatimonadota bacterium]MBT6149584.1 pyruvate dehydrogenase (acetyl-transferring), homodimeric type [Gemmatimonadota bacterium]MBT7862182.1 pyruvate dehydrogenase (acetyl-transferring), homodimeric type [Gemmatimonadota bacterium]
MTSQNYTDGRDVETQEWLDSLEYVLEESGPERVIELLDQLQNHARRQGVGIPFASNTPYVNTIPADRQPPFPGSHELEQRIRNIMRWNAMMMVVRANHEDPTMGGHISTYASAATLYEVAFNHFIRGRREGFEGDQVFFQAHTSPGIYARAFLEGRLPEEKLRNFRHELREGGGLPSYPHPRLMPDFWQFPSAAMGLAPIQAIYQARYNRYLQDRGLKEPSDAKVWAFIGDGETDEPESLGAISLAAREGLDNLLFVINCNLQRLDGPVRGNGKIIQELETVFRGAGWNVIKVIWGSDWDPLLARDPQGLLSRRMGELVDGQYQKYSVSSGDYQRNHFFGVDPRLQAMSTGLTDEQIRTIRRGGHDPNKVYAAFKAAMEFNGAPTVILAKTIKGYGMGSVGEGTMSTHQVKKLDIDVLREIRTRFGIPLSDAEVDELPYYRPPEDSPELRYLFERREALGGFVPRRLVQGMSPEGPNESLFDEFEQDSGGREVSTTMVFVRILAKLLRDPQIGRYIVPMVPDEARTFGMEALFRQYGIYSHIGQLYDPVDSESLTYYREARDGQLIEEGICEAGALSSFIAAGSAYATHGVPTLPFFIFYSIFGFQRVGDLIYAAGDQRARGFLIGATSGRTTLNGEGLQHQDGHSHVSALTCPHVVAYDAAFGYELAVIIRDGIRRMYVEGEDVIYYLTVQNENYEMPPMPDGAEEGILKGVYPLQASSLKKKKGAPAARRAHLFGSSSILGESLRAAKILEEDYDVPADVWSVTSYKQLHEDGVATERWNLLHPDEDAKRSYLSGCLEGTEGAFVVASDYVKALPDMIARWFPRAPVTLGTDGFGRSESREALRHYFEVDAKTIAYAALADLARQGVIESSIVTKARTDLGIDPERDSPVRQ